MRQPKFDATLRAAEWLLRVEDGPLTEADKAEFLAWLKASPVHVREYLGVTRAGRRLPLAFSKQTLSDLQEVHDLMRHLRLAEHKGLRGHKGLREPRELTEHKGRHKINGGSTSD